MNLLRYLVKSPDGQVYMIVVASCVAYACMVAAGWVR